MQGTEAQELLLEILNYAQKGKSLEFRLITSWAEFKFIRQTFRSTQLVIEVLKDSADNLFKHYCKEVATGSANLTELLAYVELLDIKTFYEKDLDTLKRMLDEYDEYLGQGHFLYSFLGGERETWQR